MKNGFNIARSWLVHFYTATGLIAAFLAFRALLDGNARTVFLWLGLALFIDATDGPLARRWEVSRWIPTFNGRKLDDIVDYINYTLIPMIFAYQFGIVTGLGMVVLVVVLMVSAYGFSQEEAKTDDGFFTGFPSYWNLVIFYLYLLDLAPWVSAVVLGCLCSSRLYTREVSHLEIACPAPAYNIIESDLVWVPGRIDVVV